MCKVISKSGDIAGILSCKEINISKSLIHPPMFLDLVAMLRTEYLLCAFHIFWLNYPNGLGCRYYYLSSLLDIGGQRGLVAEAALGNQTHSLWELRCCVLPSTVGSHRSSTQIRRWGEDTVLVCPWAAPGVLSIGSVGWATVPQFLSQGARNLVSQEVESLAQDLMAGKGQSRSSNPHLGSSGLLSHGKMVLAEARWGLDSVACRGESSGAWHCLQCRNPSFKIPFHGRKERAASCLYDLWRVVIFFQTACLPTHWAGNGFSGTGWRLAAFNYI